MNERRGAWCAIALLIALSAGCANNAQTGAIGGAGIGALAGQAIGGNTEATLIGTAVGLGVGYIIGNEEDKKQARQISQATRSSGYAHNQVGSLGGSRWRVISLAPSSRMPAYTSKILEFTHDGRVITTTTNADGSVQVVDETYRVVGSTLIINRPGYLINAEYGISGDQLIIDAEDFRAVLERLPA